MSKTLKMLALTCSAISLLALTSCASLTSSHGRTDPAPAREFCLIAHPIRWSVKDTDETIRQAREHNAVGKKLCGWGTKPASGS